MHSRTVGRYARITAVELGLSAERVERVRVAGVLHDVGKIGVSDPVLVKTGPLEEDDWRELRTHPEIGAQLLSRPELADLRAWVLAHHERPDGTGYPAGLSGDDIPLEARILAVADAYEAMTRGRVYREALGREAAREELRAGSGSQFDGKVVDAFLERSSRSRTRHETRPRQLSQSSHKVVRSCTVSCPGGGAEATARLPRRRLAVGTLLATHALKTTDAPLSLRAVRLLDLAVLALALPVFLAAGWPLFAWAGVTAVWLFQRGVQELVQRRARDRHQPAHHGRPAERQPHGPHLVHDVRGARRSA